jgi:hypothetical protein
MYTCTECGGYCVSDRACCDLICTDCGLCFRDVTLAWPEEGLPFDSSSIQTKTVYEPIKYLKKKLLTLKLTSAQHQEVTRVFQRIASVYQDLKGDRKSNLHYFYTIRKILELLGCFEESYTVPEVKGWKKLTELDAVWQRICDRLGYEFLPSV